MAKQWPPKDPDEVLDYRIEWTDRLTSESLSTSTWFISGPDSALVQDSATIEDTQAVVWLSAGTLGAVYTLTNRVTTSAARTMDQTVRLKIKEK